MKKRILLVLTVLTILLCVPTIIDAAGIELGDYVQMGTYYNEPILWRCVAFGKIDGYDANENPIINFTDNITELTDGYLPLMLADKIICIKPFDAEGEENTATGSHSRHSARQSWGSNYWADSNMRSWLNSYASAGNVNWLCGNPPDKEHVWSCNEYDLEAGFLSNFTHDELNAVKEVTQKSLLSYPEYEAGMAESGTEAHRYDYDIADIITNYDTAYAEYVTDKMFLLDVKQVNTVYKNGNVLGEDYYIGEPNAKCVVNSGYQSDGNLEVGKKWQYWLRSPETESDSFVRNVYPSVGVGLSRAKYDIVGVRPAFYLNDNTEFISGAGSEKNPYIIDDYPDEYFTTILSTDNVMVTNVSGRTQTAMVIAADYTDGMLSDIHMQTETFSAGESKQFQYGQGTEHKVLVWDGIAGMRPLTE